MPGSYQFNKNATKHHNIMYTCVLREADSTDMVAFGDRYYIPENLS